MSDKEVSICHIELGVDPNKIKEALVIDDKTLITCIVSYCGKLDEDVEIFQQFSNAIVTDEGWYIALYSKDLEEVEDG